MVTDRSSFHLQLVWSSGNSCVRSTASIQASSCLSVHFIHLFVPIHNGSSMTYTCLLPAVEGILEDSVVEGIDRKDVFFYQVQYVHV